MPREEGWPGRFRAARWARTISSPWSTATSPNPARLPIHHRLPRLAAERLGELRQVGHDAVHAVFAGRVRVGDGVDAQVLRALVLAGPLREADEEALLRRKAFAAVQRLARHLGFPGHPRENFAAKIGRVFAHRQLAVDRDVI